MEHFLYLLHLGLLLALLLAQPVRLQPPQLLQLVLALLLVDRLVGRRILELLGHDLLLHSNIGTILLTVGLPRFPVYASRLRTYDRNLCDIRLGSSLAQPVIHTIYTIFFVLVFFCIRKSICT